MSQEERLERLISYFLREKEEYEDIRIPANYNDRRRLLRSLLNVRIPGPVPAEILALQDDFLKAEAEEKGIVEVPSIPVLKNNISLWQGDITRLKVDAIVNAANSQLLGCFVPCHGCIDNAINTAAGLELREECNEIMKEKRKHYGPWYEEPNGRAVLTKGYNLPSRYVIHTVGPIVQVRVTEKNREDLMNCYRSILECARSNNIRTLAFCCISTGEFHYPSKEAAELAVKTVEEFNSSYPEAFERIIFNVFKDEDLRIYQKVLS